MGRKTQYNRITSPEKLALVNPKNEQLKKDFLAYLRSLQRSEGTIVGYNNDLDIVNVYILEFCDNRDFVDIKKRQFVAMQSWLIDEHGNSPARVRRIKAAVSSMSNFIINVLQEDEEPGFENFKPSIKSIENPVNEPVREKTILSEEDCKAMLDYLVEHEKYEQACFLAISLYSGRRKAEVLRFKTYHFNDDHLICNGALYSTLEKIKSKGRGKNGKMLVFYTLKDAKPYIDLWMKEREALGIESEWMFPNRSNPTVARDISSADYWANNFTKILTEVSGRDQVFYCHAARHWLCTYFSKAGVPAAVIKEYYGWSSDMISVYDDNEATDSFGDYFTLDGVKGAEAKSLADL